MFYVNLCDIFRKSSLGKILTTSFVHIDYALLVLMQFSCLLQLFTECQ